MIQAGLFQLYPEFADVQGSKQWTNRVLELRQKWLAEQGTTDQEIELTLGIGRKCFPRFEQVDISCILLSFQDRKYFELIDASKWPAIFALVVWHLLT